MEIKLKLESNWKKVLEAERRPYNYPHPVNQFMSQNYRLPSIYRWKIYKDGMGKPKFYIGETANLCPRRLNGYLNPGPTQATNQRIKGLLDGFLDDGWEINFEHLPVVKLNLNNFIFNQNHLNEKYNRKLIEMILTVYYKNNGHELFNE